jgi:DEAD/DEAH box helicase domain-containing protein
MLNRDILVIDIETKNAFFDVGGEANVGRLDVSVACSYSYLRKEFLVFWEKDLPRLGDLLKNSRLVVGFSLTRFDLPVLDKYFDFSTRALRRVDLLEEIELCSGRRISLELLSRANLGCGKTQTSGLEAIRLWNEGKTEELKDYCLNDVRLTRDLYEKAREAGELFVPDRLSGELVRVKLDFGDKIKEALDETTLF